MPPQIQPTIPFQGFFEEALQTDRLKVLADVALNEGVVAIDATIQIAADAALEVAKAAGTIDPNTIEQYDPPPLNKQPREEWDEQRAVSLIRQLKFQVIIIVRRSKVNRLENL